MKRLLTTLLLAAAAWTAPAQGRIETFTLRSDILGCEKSCSVYLPEGYDDTTDDYPVLYLLHQRIPWRLGRKGKHGPHHR